MSETPVDPIDPEDEEVPRGPDVDLTHDEIAAHGLELIVEQVATVTLAGPRDRVEILSDGSADIYFTVDGSEPTIGGANTFRIPAGAPSREAQPVCVGAGDGDVAIVRLVSPGTPVVSVQGARS